MTPQHTLNQPSTGHPPSLEKDIGSLASRWQQGLIDDSTLAAGYFLLWQIERHGKRFASRKRADAPACTPELIRALIFNEASPTPARELSRILASHHHLKVPECAIRALIHWLQGDPSACLHTRIPHPREVLDLQCKGKRPVTLILDFPRARTPVLSKTDGQAFLLHDLEHVTKFTLDGRSHARQLGFFRALRKALDEGVFAEPLGNASFHKAFDYLISDMNSHPIHCLRYLRAILVEQALRTTDSKPGSLNPAEEQRLLARFEMLASLWQLESEQRKALLEIGQGRLVSEAAKSLEDWFERLADHSMDERRSH